MTWTPDGKRIARLQLQEQRVITASRQLAETQNALTAVRTKIAGERARAGQLDEAASRVDQGRAAFQQAILEAGTQIEQLQKQEFQLQTRERELQRAMTDEQTRWTDFNDRLDALERSLPASISH